MILTSNYLAVSKSPIVLPWISKVNGRHPTQMAVMGRTECAIRRLEAGISESLRCLTFQTLEAMNTPGLRIRGEIAVHLVSFISQRRCVESGPAWGRHEVSTSTLTSTDGTSEQRVRTSGQS